MAEQNHGMWETGYTHNEPSAGQDGGKMVNFDMGKSIDDGLAAEFDTPRHIAEREVEQSFGPVKEILTNPDMRALVAESKIPAMLEHDLGEGVKLGNSKAIRTALAEAGRKIEYRRSQVYGETPMHGRSLVSREQEMAFRREALTIIQAELMRGRAEFIKRTGMPLPGWMY